MVNSKKVYLFYSGATDITGKTLVEELGIKGGKTKPTGTTYKVVVGWGAKTKEDISFSAGVRVLNHPNAIRKNRNKLNALKMMADNDVNVGVYGAAKNIMTAINNGNIKFPLLGRTKFHQGGKGLWICLNKTQVKAARDEGAQYFREYQNITQEYRVHVCGGKVIYAQKKVTRSNMEEAFVDQYGKKIKSVAEKNDVALDEDTLAYVLRRMAKYHPTPDHIVKSNYRGWKFSRVTNNNLAKNLKDEAVKAVSALGLDFGAVDIGKTEDGGVVVLEVNTGPGLEGSSLKAWKTALTSLINSKLAPAEVAAHAVEPDQEEVAKKVAGKKLSKKTLLGKVQNASKVFEGLVDAAETDEELETLNKLFTKTFKVG